VSGERDDEPLEADFAPEPADAFDDPDALDALRANAFESVGTPLAEGILYGLGLAEGLFHALSIERRFGGPLGGEPRHAGPGLGLLFSPRGVTRQRTFGGVLPASIEAVLHRRRYGGSAHPICHVSAGYCAGWYSALLGEFVLVRETACAGAGAAACEFEARPAERWTQAGEPWAAHLLQYLDFEAMRENARKRITLSLDGVEGDMLGAFDPLSPAVHVWGPVMVLPYSGAGDSIAALDTIASDLGSGVIRVVVLDVTGARVDGPEAMGLVRTLDVLAQRDMESVVVGVSDDVATRWLGGRSGLALPLRAADVGEGIRLAFQLATFT